MIDRLLGSPWAVVALLALVVLALFVVGRWDQR